MNKEIPKFKNEDEEIYEKWREALELIFRDYSYHLKMGMGKDKQKELFDVIVHEIESLGHNE